MAVSIRRESIQTYQNIALSPISHMLNVNFSCFARLLELGKSFGKDNSKIVLDGVGKMEKRKKIKVKKGLIHCHIFCLEENYLSSQ